MAIQGLNPDWMEQPKFGNPITKTGHITHKFEDVPYGDDPLQKLDIYLPETGEGPFPAILMIHGGGLMVCDKHDFHLYPLLYALEEGFAIIGVNYRLSPQVKYPTHVYDTKQAMLYLADHAAEYKLDKDNFFLWGTSGGGNLVLMGGLKEGLPLPAELKRADQVPVRAVAALCAEATMTEMGGLGSGLGTWKDQLTLSILFAGMYKKVLGVRKPTQEQLDFASVFSYLPKGIAPLYIQHGDQDPAVPYAQSVRLYEEAKKVLPEEDLVLDTLPGAAHAGAGIDYFEKKNVTPILDFFKKHLWRPNEQE